MKSEESFLFLVRHGESEGNVDPTLYSKKPQWNIELTDKGHRQCKSLKPEIAKRVNPEQLMCYSSPYVRAMQSASNIFDGPIRKEFLLHEQFLGAAEGTTSMIKYKSENEYEIEMYNKSGLLHYRPARGENMSDVYVRAGLCIEKFRWFEHSKYNIVVAHRGLCLMMHAYLTGEFPDVSYFDWKTTLDWPNAEIRRYKISDRNVELIEKIPPKL